MERLESRFTKRRGAGGEEYTFNRTPRWDSEQRRAGALNGDEKTRKQLKKKIQKS